MTYAALTAVLLGAFWASPNIAWIQWLLVAAVGFALYGPQMLIGLCGAEVVPKPAVSAAQGFLGWISYLGKLHPLLSSICVCAASQDQMSVSMAFKGGPADVWAHRHAACRYNMTKALDTHLHHMSSHAVPIQSLLSCSLLWLIQLL